MGHCFCSLDLALVSRQRAILVGQALKAFLCMVVGIPFQRAISIGQVPKPFLCTGMGVPAYLPMHHCCYLSANEESAHIWMCFTPPVLIWMRFHYITHQCQLLLGFDISWKPLCGEMLMYTALVIFFFPCFMDVGKCTGYFWFPFMKPFRAHQKECICMLSASRLLLFEGLCQDYW